MTDGYRFVGMPVVVLATAVLIHAGYGHPQSPVARLLSLGPLAAIGRYSYSLYLWHAVPLVLLDKDVMALPTWALGLIGCRPLRSSRSSVTGCLSVRSSVRGPTSSRLDV